MYYQIKEMFCSGYAIDKMFINECLKEEGEYLMAQTSTKMSLLLL